MKYALTHATLLDGTADMQPQNDMTVLIDEKGLIASVGPSATTDPGGRWVDGNSTTLADVTSADTWARRRAEELLEVGADA